MRLGARSKKELIGAGLFLLLAVGIWIYSARFPDLPEGYPGPALFPRLISGGFFFCSVLLLLPEIWKLLSSRNEENFKEPDRPVRSQNSPLFLVGGIVLLALYPLVHDFLGFVPALGISIFLMGLLLNLRLLNSLIVSIASLACIYLTFNVFLGVPL